jgi:hypothetical protein
LEGCEPSILDPQPSILNPQTSILDPRLQTLNPQSSIIIPQTSTLNPRPSTLNPLTQISARRRVGNKSHAKREIEGLAAVNGVQPRQVRVWLQHEKRRRTRNGVPDEDDDVGEEGEGEWLYGGGSNQARDLQVLSLDFHTLTPKP